MLAGDSVPSAEAIPSLPHGHGLGHSRGRGHSRRSTPISQPVSSYAFPPAQQRLSQPSTNTTGLNGHAENPEKEGHQHSHSHGASHDDHYELPSVAQRHDPKTLRIQAEASPKYLEIVAGLTIALPWIALSWYYEHYAQWTPREVESALPAGNLDRISLRTSGLTAATLLFYGGGAVLRQSQQTGSESVIRMPKLDLATACIMLSQICAIGLPIYATLKVGGFLVAFAVSLAVGSGLPTMIRGHNPVGNPRVNLSHKYWTVGLLLVVIGLSFLGLNASWNSDPLFGYVALLASVFLIHPPFATTSHSSPAPGHELGNYTPVRFDNSSKALLNSDSPTRNPIIPVVSGLVLALYTFLIRRGISVGALDVVYLLIAAGSVAACLTFLELPDIRSQQKIGVAVATGSAALFCAPPAHDNVYVVYVIRFLLSAVSFFAAKFDDRRGEHSSEHHHHYLTTESSQATKLILYYSEPYPLIYSILKERDSRRIFYFMSLNFAFMLVQLSYGFATGSLGLLSDSIHMFFDCLALVVGLCAAVMSKWPPSTRFPYGYGKVDTLSGFANGIFLMIISVEIIYEAVERLSSGSQMHRLGELLAVSTAGLLVNLVGIMAFDHGHAHGHDHGHGHSHSHGNENMHGIFLHILADTLGSVAVVISTILVHYSGWSGYDPIASCIIAILIFASAVPLVSGTAKSLLLTLPGDVEYNVRETLAGVSTLRGVVGYTVPKFWLDDTELRSSGHGHHHSHGHDHNHSHNHANTHTCSHSQSHCQSHDYGDAHDHSNSGAQNSDHAHGHSHEQNHDNHDRHDHGHEKTNPRVLGVIHVTVSRAADQEDVRRRTIDFLREKGMDILVQVEREGEGHCWCGAGGSKAS
ncbi:metal cation transporter MSC2 [Aspergillus lucknowensis]|uniref:Zinc transporter n=1 Tax=Aspergillus lucknowensis TaxID=176173 RepID=A0ABR4LYS1_9EURO